MNKTNFILSTLASFTIVAASMPVAILSSTPVVSAASACVDISDDFSTDTGMWELFTPESSINGGVLTLVASDNQELGDPNLTYSDATLIDSSTGDNVALYGDWEMSYETLLKSTPTATPDAEMFWWGGELYTLETGTTSLDNLYANYAGYETGSTFRFADTLNATKTGFDTIVAEAASFDPYTDTVTITYKKEGSLLSGGISFDGVTFYEQGTNVDIGEPIFFRFTSQNYLADSNLETEVEFDNFSLTCAEVVDPTPEPTVDTTTPFDVQRFFNIRIGSAHFYSIDPVEAKFVEDNSKAGGLWPGAFVKEAPTFAAFNYDSVNDKCMDGTSPVYRYLNRTTGDTHFYAIKADEISAVEGQFASTFKPEGVSFCAYLNEATGSVPVYRWQNKILGSTHFYSASPTEVNVVNNDLSATFSPEGIAFYGMPVDNVDYSVQIVDPTAGPTDSFTVEASTNAGFNIFSSDEINFSFEFPESYGTVTSAINSIGNVSLEFSDSNTSMKSGIVLGLGGTPEFTTTVKSADGEDFQIVFYDDFNIMAYSLDISGGLHIFNSDPTNRDEADLMVEEITAIIESLSIDTP